MVKPLVNVLMIEGRRARSAGATMPWTVDAQRNGMPKASIAGGPGEADSLVPIVVCSSIRTHADTNWRVQ
jgi:hypothetical protein